MIILIRNPTEHCFTGFLIALVPISVPARDPLTDPGKERGEGTFQDPAHEIFVDCTNKESLEGTRKKGDKKFS